MNAPAELHVLLVEDNGKLAGIVQRILALDGIHVDVAGSAEDGLQMAARAHYDAVVLDVLLPGMDGLELCRRLRRGGLQAPVVVISARDDLTARELRDAGTDHFLAKPFAMDDLEERIRRALTLPSWRAPEPCHAPDVADGVGIDRRGWWPRRRAWR